MVKCKHCGVEIEIVPGKVQKQFCNDAHRKAYKRANSGKSEATAAPPVDEPRTDGTNQPRTSTPDESTSDIPKSGIGIVGFEVGYEAGRRIAEKISHSKPKCDTQVITASGITEKIAEVKRRTPLTNKPERTDQGNIRVSKPGDDDYVPMCETTRAFVKDSGLCPYCLKRPTLGDNAIACEECSQMTLVDTPKPKCGKDIKCFGDLPPDVQASIDRLSVIDGKIDQTIKTNRTAVAVNYQHEFPDRFHSTGVN